VHWLRRGKKSATQLVIGYEHYNHYHQTEGVVVHEITTQEIAFFAFVWSVAFASTIARAIRDGDTGSVFRSVGLGATAGFLALGIVGCWLDRGTNGFANTNPWFWIGISSLIGGLGKEQDRLRVMVWEKIFGKQTQQ
jgi:hypothetical protein